MSIARTLRCYIHTTSQNKKKTLNKKKEVRSLTSFFVTSSLLHLPSYFIIHSPWYCTMGTVICSCVESLNESIRKA